MNMTLINICTSERKINMTSIETLESVKNKLTPDEYNSIAKYFKGENS